MKILFLTTWYPSPDSPGKGLFVKEHAAAVLEAGYDVRMFAVVIVPHTSLVHLNYREFTDEHGVMTHELTIGSRYHKKLHAITPLLSRYAWRCFRDRIQPVFKPEIIHAHVLHPAAIMARKISKRTGTPYLVTEHWSKAGKYIRKNPEGMMIGRKVYNEAAAITTVSDFQRKAILPFVADPEKISIVPNVVDNITYSFLPKQKQKTKLVFSAVASWRLPKRPDLIVAALDRLAASGVETELHFFGDGPQLDAFRNRQSGQGAHLVFRGYCGKKEIAGQLQQSDFFLHASEIETFSIVVAEALSTGTPVIASNRGAIPELVEEGCGLLCDNTPEAWHEALSQAIQMNFDHARIAEKIGTRFSRGQVGRMFGALYTKIKTGTR